MLFLIIINYSLYNKIKPKDFRRWCSHTPKWIIQDDTWSLTVISKSKQ